jgi:tetratricopeptide (TPR) repeat protein
MSAEGPGKVRHLLPRWRKSEAAIWSGELLTIPAAVKEAPTDANPDDFENLLQEWQERPSAEVAAELLASGIVLGRFSEISAVAALLASESSDVSPTLRMLAQRVVNRANGRKASVEPTETATDFESIRAAIAATRGRVREWPRNAIAWVDLAYSYSVLGQTQQATRALEIALKLAPENRFVLRSSVRHFADSQDLERGLAILRRAELTRNDPWLMSAEIALANANDESPRLFKKARAISDADRIEPWQTGELNAAIGSLELRGANVGKARKYFKKSLRKPTENVVAQAQWASNEHHLLEVPLQVVYSSKASEAIALRSRIDRRWNDLIEACRQWLLAEPTSIHPLVLGSYIAEVALEDGHLAGQFTDVWMMRDPTNVTALNNHAVAMAYQGNIQEESRHFKRINRSKIEGRTKVVLGATEGLLAYRGGDVEKGRQLYLQAAQSPEAVGANDLVALVLWHLLREEARIGMPGTSELSTLLWDRTRHINLPEIKSIKETVDKASANARDYGLAGKISFEQSRAVREKIAGLLKPSFLLEDPEFPIM